MHTHIHARTSECRHVAASRAIKRTSGRRKPGPAASWPTGLSLVMPNCSPRLESWGQWRIRVRVRLRVRKMAHRAVTNDAQSFC